MMWPAVRLSLELALWTSALMIPIGMLIGRLLAYRAFPGRAWIEALVALPLVLPPTVLGYYLLVMFSPESLLGSYFELVTGHALAFSFPGLVLASMLFNLPFAIQPLQQGFSTIPAEVREAAWCCGLGWWQTLVRVELPLAWSGIVAAFVLTFAHTVGEFGVVLMVGGNIPEQTQTLSIAIYEQVQAFEMKTAGTLSAFLLVFSLVSIAMVRGLHSRGLRV